MLKKAKPSAPKYAQLVPKLRSMKARLLTMDRLREVIAQPSISEAVSLLKDTIYGDALGPWSLGKIQTNLTKFYCRKIDSIAKITPREAKPLIEAFKHEVEVGDLVVLAIASGRGGERPEVLTEKIESCAVSKILSEPDALTSTTRFLELVQETWASKYIPVLRKAADASSPARASWARLAIISSEYSRALESLEKGISKRNAARVLCPMLNWMLASTLIQAKREGVDAKLIDEILVDVPSCGFKVGKARLVYEREAGVEGIVASIREILPGVRIDPSKEIVESLEDARINARREAFKHATGVFTGYPFHAGILAAGIVLLKFNIEDLITILHGIELKLSSEDYLPLTVLT